MANEEIEIVNSTISKVNEKISVSYPYYNKDGKENGMSAREFLGGPGDPGPEGPGMGFDAPDMGDF